MNTLKHILTHFLRHRLLSFRKQQKFTQEQMAQKLHISPRSYCDQERGLCGFSSLSLILFLLQLSDDEALRLLHQLRDLLADCEDHCD